MTQFPLQAFRELQTPFYYYDIDLLHRGLSQLKQETHKYGFCEHYAVKANANPRILETIASYGFGADCVSGWEIEAALNAGFPAHQVVFAGVGKSDVEIDFALKHDIACFNVESIPELEVLNALAAAQGKTARIALRINPNLDAHTHAKITTGKSENKFGIHLSQLDGVLQNLGQYTHLQFQGLHVHIGSQITEMEVFERLCTKVNEITRRLQQAGYTLATLNFGGGLGIDYQHPEEHPLPDYAAYFEVFNRCVERPTGQQLHFELGRAVVAPCGSLISQVLYVKEGESKRFVILDAGMNDLVRPAMYDAYHHIQNLNAQANPQTYDVVGPVCESSDVFGTERILPTTHRGDLVAIRSAGAYGEVMASHYNLRPLAPSVFSDTIGIPQ